MKKILTIALLFLLVGCSSDSGEKEMNTPDTSPETDTPITTEPLPTNPVEMVELTLEELSMYNGTDMDEMYVAVDGVIYDVTSYEEWSSGSHQGVDAGTDATDAFAGSPHKDEFLADLPVVGSIISETVIEPIMLELTLDELSKYNGVDMEYMYIAVDGNIYDVTGYDGWSTGVHNGVEAGTDASIAFAGSPHKEEFLADLPFVGTLKLIELPTFSLEQLAVYNGVDMTEIYVAVDGFVYDMTEFGAWETGEHYGVEAGTDATDAFAGSPHKDEFLADLEIVGILIN